MAPDKYEIVNNNNVLIAGNGVPYGIRTRVAAVKGQCPRPLDEGDGTAEAVRQAREHVAG